MRAVLLAILLLAPLAASQAPAADAPGGWWTSTRLDLDRDGLDDALRPLLRGADPLVVLVAYAHPPTPAQKAALAAAGGAIAHEYRHFPLLAVRALPADLPRIAHAPGVVLVERDDALRPQLKESVPLMGVPRAATTYGVTGRGVTIALLDDGSFDQHPDLRAKVAAAYDAAGPEGTPLGDAPVDVVAPAGEDGHATHVAGTLVGGGEQSNGAYKGVAPAARYVNVKVFQGPNQTSSTLVLKGLDWVLDRRDELDIRIVVMSLGGRPSDGTDALSRAVNVAVDDGLVVVAAAGNNGPGESTVSSPGAATKAITVGAVDKRRSLASFSARGPTLDGRTKPDVAAPGVGIVSTVPPTRGSAGFLVERQTVFYGALSGTSMAAPHVAGVAALMLEANPDLAPHDVKRILMATAQDQGERGPDNGTGHGFVNALAAVQVAKDPSLLDSPQMRARLATIPEPEPESPLMRLSYQMERLGRSGALLEGALVAGLFATLVVGLLLLRRRGGAGTP